MICWRNPSIVGFNFKLCYGWTSLLLIAFSFIITCRLLFGESFECISRYEGLSLSYLNMKCYRSTVYTLPVMLIQQEGKSISVEPSVKDYRRYQSYYSWVNLVFLVQAFNFYLPYLLWKSYDNGYTYRLIAEFQKYGGSGSGSESGKNKRMVYDLSEYIVESAGTHCLYATIYILCEVLNFAISVAQTLWLLHFFNVTGVPEFLPHTLETWSDFKNFYFPSESFCELEKVTASGDIAHFKTVCQLPLNSLYMKMFLFLHAWYILLALLTGLPLIFNIAYYLFFKLRYLATTLVSPLVPKEDVRSVVTSQSYCDWFFLVILRKGMAQTEFSNVLRVICEIMFRKRSDNFLDESGASSSLLGMKKMLP